MNNADETSIISEMTKMESPLDNSEEETSNNSIARINTPNLKTRFISPRQP